MSAVFHLCAVCVDPKGDPAYVDFIHELATDKFDLDEQRTHAAQLFKEHCGLDVSRKQVVFLSVTRLKP